MTIEVGACVWYQTTQPSTEKWKYGRLRKKQGQVWEILNAETYALDCVSEKSLANAEARMERAPGSHENLQRVHDLSTTAHVNEASMVMILSARFHQPHRPQIYTMAGPVLISLNPFTQTSLYTLEKMNQYADFQRQSRHEAPHIYQIARNAFSQIVLRRKQLDREDSQDPPCPRRNQSIVITGESGTGKSEVRRRRRRPAHHLNIWNILIYDA